MFVANIAGRPMTKLALCMLPRVELKAGLEIVTLNFKDPWNIMTNHGEIATGGQKAENDK